MSRKTAREPLKRMRSRRMWSTPQNRITDKLGNLGWAFRTHSNPRAVPWTSNLQSRSGCYQSIPYMNLRHARETSSPKRTRSPPATDTGKQGTPLPVSGVRSTSCRPLQLGVQQQ